MHGRARSEYKEPTEVEKEHFKKAKKLFEECLRLIGSERKSNSFSDSTFKMTEKLLKFNPEIPSFWNYRKDFIQSLIKNKDKSKVIETVNNEFYLTEKLFEVDPKSYSLWSNRIWLIELVLNGECSESMECCAEKESDDENNVGLMDVFKLENNYLEKVISTNNFSFSQEFKHYLSKYMTTHLKLLTNELELCKKLLDIDDRNFHCWKHRSHMLFCLRYLSVRYNWEDFEKNLHFEEFKFLNKLIENNFSNYSAWHQRILLSGNNYLFDSLDDFNRELKLIHTAIFTEPNDQSIWQYYTWLMDKLLPSIIFKNNDFSVSPTFFIKKTKLESPLKNIDKLNDNTHSISIQLSNNCLISQDNSKVILISKENKIIPIKNGNWIPIYSQDIDEKNNENSVKFINKGLPNSFRSTINKFSDNWKFTFEFEDSGSKETDIVLRELVESGNVKILFNLLAASSEAIHSNKPLWSLENELFKVHYFSFTKISPKIKPIENKKYQFIVQKEESSDDIKFECRYHYYFEEDVFKGNINISNTILSNLEEWRKILLSEFQVLKEIQELEPQCKYPILSLKKVFDIFSLCIPYDLSKGDKMLFNSDLINNLPVIDPQRKGYYSQRFGNNIN